MRRWLRASVRTKLMTVAMATTTAALLLAGLVIVAYQLVYAQRSLALELGSRADLIGRSSTAAVQFRDSSTGEDGLGAFRGDGAVEAARIDLPDGSPFAVYEARPSRIPARLPEAGVTRIGETMIVSRAIELDGRTIGSIRVQGSLARARAQVISYVWILLAVLGASLFLAYFLSLALQRVISGPIISLAAIAGRVAVDRDYSVRAVKTSDDELGQLVEQFNDMLSQIELRDEALREAQTQLEARVHERTSTLELEVLERRRTENALIFAKAAAEQANVAKSAFLANMSHELRTPLNAIIGYSEMLIEDAQDRHETEALADLTKITTAGRHLLALITDVLDLSKIESGRMELHVEPFAVSELVQSVVATSQTLAAARHNALTVSGLDDLGTLRSDQTKTQQVLLNLISNACKFTSDGRVHVACRRDSSELGDRLVIDVTDTGIGMDPEQVSRVFQEFVQADSSTTRRFGGTGLGLAVSLRLCRLMGGTIAVDSALGRGSTFTMTLPVEAPESARRRVKGTHLSAHASASGQPAALPPASMSRQHDERGSRFVLVVDDDRTSRDLATRALQKAGCHVVESSSAAEGLRLARSMRPDVVILDVVMPDMTGWELLDEMKRDADLAEIPVVVLSTLDDRHQSLSLGAVAHLLKPCVAEHLVEVVHSALAGSAAKAQVVHR